MLVPKRICPESLLQEILECKIPIYFFELLVPRKVQFGCSDILFLNIVIMLLQKFSCMNVNTSVSKMFLGTWELSNLLVTLWYKPHMS